jgi:hypothetical protein
LAKSIPTKEPRMLPRTSHTAFAFAVWLSAGCNTDTTTRGSADGPSTDTVTTTAATTDPRIWLTTGVRTRLRQRAASGDPAWTALRSHCDALATGTVQPPSGNAYPNAPDVGQGYQGDGYLPEILALGLCYQTATGVDDASAARWAQAGARVLAAMATPVGSGGQPPSRDDGYGIRNYGVGMALGFDWLRPALDAATRALVAASLDTWIAWYDAKGFSKDEPIGNYFAGYLFAKAAAAIALEGDDTNATAWWTDVSTRMWPTLVKPAYSQWLEGGGWPEGWQYGPLAVRNVVGFLWAAFTGKGETWWNEANVACDEVEYIAEFAWPSQKHMDDRGTVHAQAALKPSAVTVAMLATALEQQKIAGAPAYQTALAPVARSEAAELKAATGESDDPWQTFLFWDSAAPATAVSTLATSYLASGPGHVAMRSSWATDATWASFASGPYTDAPDSGEQYFDAGGLAVAHADVPVLVNATGWLPQAAGDSGEQFVYDDTWGNRTRLLDNTFYASGAIQTGNDPTKASTHLERYEDSGAWLHVRGTEIEQMYTPAGVVTQFKRDLAYVRPGTFVVYDRTTVAQGGNDQWIAWHVPGTPAQSKSADGTPRFDVANGGTLRALLPADASPHTTDLLNVVTRIELHTTAASQDWLTTLTVGASPEVHRLSTADGNVTSGAALGAHVASTPRESVVLFGSDHAAASPCTAVDYAVKQAADADHVIFDMAPSPSGYSVTATPSAGALAVHVTPGGASMPTPQGTLAFAVSPSGAVTDR